MTKYRNVIYLGSLSLLKSLYFGVSTGVGLQVTITGLLMKMQYQNLEKDSVCDGLWGGGRHQGT